MLERTSQCVGCGAVLVNRHARGAVRKWCSERCRRRTLYGIPCVDCGTRTNGSQGRGPHAEIRCARCSERHVGNIAAEAAAEHYAKLIALRREGLLNWQIADLLGIASTSVTDAFSRARRRGYFVPPCPATGSPAHRESAVDV